MLEGPGDWQFQHPPWVLSLTANLTPTKKSPDVWLADVVNPDRPERGGGGHQFFMSGGGCEVRFSNS